ncbi:hypothetical protein KP509_37G024900 [Ceratopteris richardii]|uniref:non-specific serine/threonine protein kinase n=1 Tax=Ceratopteris richardii TaxID=49495 RepID=A0A8T2Q7G6_CERRI|nr:hypothetical protein KP509_37G024900 [Ceratopteris richardii]
MSEPVNSSLTSRLSQRTSFLELKLWQIIAVAVGVFTTLILVLLCLRLFVMSRRRSKRQTQLLPVASANSVIPDVSKEIKEVENYYKAHDAEKHDLPEYELAMSERILLSVEDSSDDEKQVFTFGYGEGKQATPRFHNVRSKTAPSVEQGIKQVNDTAKEHPSRTEAIQERLKFHNQHGMVCAECNVVDSAGIFTVESISSTEDPSACAPLSLAWTASWSKRYRVDQLAKATNEFAENNVIGRGGCGIVYRGQFPDASMVAVKQLLNSGALQAEKEFRVEVETIGRVRHKNLVGLMGYCSEGPERMLVYEYVDNGNLEQWLHGPLGEENPIPWDARMKIVLGTAKGLAYLHEDLEPTVVHRDVKSSNILLDREWNAKVSDFGLAKPIRAGNSHSSTKVMGTFGYIAPEYVSTGVLTESSDVYSFGVLMMEVITGRKPVDYTRPSGEVNLVDWMKRMVGGKRWEEMLDTRMKQKPSSRDMKRALLVALRCVDPDANQRPRMSNVVYMLDADDVGFRNAFHRSSWRWEKNPK